MKTNVVNGRNAETSFLNELSKALNNDSHKVSAQFLCSAPKIVPTGDKCCREQSVAVKA